MSSSWGMRCPNCDYELFGKTICPNCGLDVTLTKCPYCGKEISGEKICPHCVTEIATGKPKHSPLPMIIYMVISLVFLIPSIWLISLNISMHHSKPDYSWAFPFIIGCIFAYISLKILLWRIRVRHAYRRDKDKYKRLMHQLVLDVDKAEKWKQERDNKRNGVAPSSNPSCPICHSKTNVRRITNIDRTVSTAAWGIASSSIGKQWECTSCNHKFNVDAAIQQPTRIEKPVSADPAVELRKYKQLLDDGVITQDDFDKKKKQLLGL